ncbi:YdgA family protein [Serratia rhizosphaerae]|uniref:DUF945 domain-containing protein n=1 Tax=Serratia rhizosphaerae TaxID=2597702 RepID=A0ABX6GSS0_9GAMM|nr:YdgA family protein [Serratia rhizosphaerae]QHA89334.1 DUF945 domain-containing protein [Serratia rhizosphaerae]
MKKSVVAVGVIAILGAAWTGASWYTGKLIEQRMGEVVSSTNSQLESYLPQAGIKLSYEDYQRGLFSSHLRFVIRPDGTASGEQAALQPGEEVVLQEVIDHGPFPFAQLKRFNLIPSMASVRTELANTPAVKTLFDIAKGKAPFTADSRIAYNGDTSTALKVLPLDYQKDGNALTFAGADLTIDVARDLKAVQVDGSSDSATLSGRTEFGQTEQITLQGITLKTDTRNGQYDLSLGDQALNIKQLKVAVDNKEALTLDGFNLASKFGEQDGNLNGQIDYTMDALKLQGADFGSGKLTLKIDKLDGKSLKEFADRYNQQMAALLQQSQSLPPEAYQEQASAIVMQNLPLLLKGNPTINVAPLSWKNSKGEGTFTLNLDLVDPTQGVSPQAPDDLLLARAVKKLDASLNLPVPMATEATAQTAKLQGYNAEEAQKLAQQQVQGLAAMGQMFKLTTLKDDVIGSRFHYADNQVELNGNKMSLQEFLGMFGMLAGPEQGVPPAPMPVPAPAPAPAPAQ